MSDNPEIPKPRSSHEKCFSLHQELNNFICSRCEEWDINEYELIGVLVLETLFQAKSALSDNSEDEEEDDEDDEF